MKAPCCQQRIEVHTDPKNAEYVIVSGGRKKVEEEFSAGDKDKERVSVDPRAEHRPSDPLSLLETAEDDKQRAVHERSRITALQQDSAARFKGDADNNRELRRAMRGARREEEALEVRREQLGLPDHVKLVPEVYSDRLRAAAVDFGGGSFKHTQAWKHGRRQIASSTIFTPQATTAARKRSEHPSGKSFLQHKARKIDSSVKLRLSEPVVRDAFRKKGV